MYEYINECIHDNIIEFKITCISHSCNESVHEDTLIILCIEWICDYVFKNSQMFLTAFMSVKSNYKLSCVTASEKFAGELVQIKAATRLQFVNPPTRRPFKAN